MATRRAAVLLAAFCALAAALFTGLGTWQVERRHWKLALIERVNARVHAPAVAAPGPAAWPRISAAGDEYRHVRLTGVFLNERCTLVQASTVLGAGWWVLTPLRQGDGTVVLVNRGFVPPADRASAPACPAGPVGAVTVEGLLRLSEPGGAFLRHNDAAANRWYSRDMAAIASARGLERVAPYFVDADAAAPAPAAAPAAAQPVGGLTVIAFHNSHLLYAIIWYLLALMSAAALSVALRDAGKRRPGG